MQEIKKGDVLNNLVKKKRKKRIIILGIIFIIVVIAIILRVFTYTYFQSPKKQLGLGANIESATISQDGRSVYIKLAGGSNIENIEKIKFIFTDADGQEHLYETGEGASEISIPYEESFWNWIFKKTKYEGVYDYQVNADDVGLDNFQDVGEVSVIFEYKTEELGEVETGVLDTEETVEEPTISSSGGSGSGGGGGGGGDGGTPTCTPDCTGKTCGDDGCGGSCGGCEEDENCENNNCVKIVECIDENDCNAGEYCNSGSCVPVGSECSVDSDCEYRGPGFVCNSGNVCEWEPPIGIPKPEFGIEETYRMYDNVENRNPDLTYTQNSEGGFYTHYVDNTHVNATNTDNLYGMAEKPRLTVPQYLIAGSVVEVHGGPYQGQSLNVWQGTVEKPIFVRGINKPDAGFGLYNDNIGWKNGEGGQYIIIEGFSSRGFSVVHSMNPPFYNHVALRNSEIHNPSSDPALSGTIGIGNNINQNPIHNIVIYNNEIHNADTLWDDESLGDWDRHGIKPFGYANNIWILDNYMHHNGGDAIQIGDYAQNPNLHHIYVGRNIAHHNRQTSFWSKSAEDVVISENTAYGSDNYAPIGMQYMPERVWFLFNNVYDGQWGFHVAGSSENLYFIGNVIHDIHDYEEYSPTNPHLASAAISVRGGSRLYAIGNTIYNVDAGIVSVTNTYYLVANNIVANVDNGEQLLDRKGMPVWLLDEGGSNNWTLSNNIFYNGSADPYVFRLGTAEYTLDETDNLYPNKSQGNAQANPQFIDAPNNDFNLQSTSPAIDAGIESEVYQTFFDLYGINISRDIENRVRPQDGDNSGTAEWDIGAYEFEGGIVATQSIPKSSSFFSTIWNWIKGLLTRETGQAIINGNVIKGNSSL